MPDLFRPLPPVPRRDRWRASLAGIGPARAVTGALTVIGVAVAAWWLLREPALPVEAGLPRATTTTARSPAGPLARAATPTSASSRSGAVTSSAEPVPAASSTPVSTIVVQVAGKVARPGVYRLPADARVVDLVDAAGGIVTDGDAATVALASHLVDGQRVVVTGVGGPVAAAPGGPTPGPAAGSANGPPTSEEPLDLNAATVADLDRLPGVGPATAAAIVAYRDAHGPFHSVDDLGEVRGIGAARLEALRALVRV